MKQIVVKGVSIVRIIFPVRLKNAGFKVTTEMTRKQRQILEALDIVRQISPGG